MSINRRRGARIVINALIRFYEESLEDAPLQYRQGVVKNYSEGGLLIFTESPLPKGSVVAVEIPVETESNYMAIVQVRGIVRWLHRLTERWEMGIEFFEFQESGCKDFSEWMTHLVE